MIFNYKKWEKFCNSLKNKGVQSIPARMVDGTTKKYIVLKHDVETNVKKAFDLALIEYKNDHCGSYYVQAYLLNDEKNVDLLKKMQKMGHEVSYHYDVMDSSKGDIELALKEFEKNKELFESLGFKVETVCQHGNPIVERNGYTSNRDFFRSERVRCIYPEVSDIMVNFQEAHSTDYKYLSDAGRRFKLIFDPLNNDIVDSSEKDVVYSDLNEVLSSLDFEGRYIISTHPHRWTKSVAVYSLKNLIFHTIKLVAKVMVKIPLMKKVMSKYYYLAKKI